MNAELIASIPELIARQAGKYPAKAAYTDDHSSVTYGALSQTTANLAGNLQALGIAPGDRVAMLLPNSVQWVQGCFAIARAGAIGVPISYESALPEIAYRLADAGCKALITTDEQMARIGGLLREAPGVAHLILVTRGADRAQGLRFDDLAGRPSTIRPLDPENLDDVAFLIYTSGTTGRAKGVMLSVRSMLWITAACWAPQVGLGDADNVLSPLPLFHSYALNLSVLSILAAGASEYIVEKYSTQEVIALLKTGRFTVMPGVPTMFHYLLEAAKAGGLSAFPGVRCFISAGAIMPGPLNEAFEKQLKVPLLDGYGITETATMVTMNALAGSRVPGSCGLPLPGLAVRIVDPSGRDMDPGAEGELIVRGPNLMLGYYNQPEATATAIRDGWYHTGDLAKGDKHGFLTITGRLKELIIRGGQNIAPAEVEVAVAQYQPVLDCAVIAAPHDKLGEVPVVFVVPRPGATVSADALLAHCRTQLSAYKVPATVYVTDSIPRTGSGKTMRYKLREKLESGQATLA